MQREETKRDVKGRRASEVEKGRDVRRKEGREEEKDDMHAKKVEWSTRRKIRRSSSVHLFLSFFPLSFPFVSNSDNHYFPVDPEKKNSHACCLVARHDPLA